MKNNVRAWLCEILRNVYQPTPTETVWAWAERELRIPAGGENSELAGQPWRSDRSPYVREIMDWFRAPGKSELFIVKSSQVGITMGILIVICWHLKHRPLNIGYCIDSVAEARKISKSRLKRWILENHLLDGLAENEDDLSNLTYYLRSMTVYLMGSYAEGAFRNKSLSIGVLDELDAHPPIDEQGTTADGMRSRLKRDRNSKLIGFSTPKLERDQIWTEYLSGTQEKYHVPCPHCGHVQPLVWKNVRFRGKEFEDLTGDPDTVAIQAGAYYECEMGCRIQEASKFDMLTRGEWRATAKPAKPNKRSMHFSDLYSNFCTWGDLAVEWLEAQTNIDKLRAFMQQRLGEPFRQTSGELKETDVLRCKQNYDRGTCPIRPVLLSLLVDVQQASMKWIIVAFSHRGDIVVVDYGEAATWDTIAELATSTVPTPEGPQPIECGFVDEGDGHRSKEVREFTLTQPHLFPVKGRGQTQIKELIWESYSLLGTDEILTYHVNDPVFKHDLLYKMILKKDRRAAYEEPTLWLPRRVTPDFVAELLNERLQKVRNKYKHEEEKWIKAGPNDFLDCLKYARALWTLMEPALREAGRLTAPPQAA